MNGKASARLKALPRQCRLVYGTELPRLAEIARSRTPSHALAQALWREDARECKILASMLMPPEAFTESDCQLWLASIPNEEIAQALTLNLFSRLPCARALAFGWMQSPSPAPYERLCAYLLLARFHMQGPPLTQAEAGTVARLARQALPTAAFALRKAIANALTHIEG